MLRIYARGPEGHERMFEYREGSVIDGGQFRGWDRGEWGTADGADVGKAESLPRAATSLF